MKALDRDTGCFSILLMENRKTVHALSGVTEGPAADVLLYLARTALELLILYLCILVNVSALDGESAVQRCIVDWSQQPSIWKPIQVNVHW
jgi:hypothetical protein